MEINAQDVINKLTRKIASLEGEKAVLEVQVEALQNQAAQTESETPIEGEVIG